MPVFLPCSWYALETNASSLCHNTYYRQSARRIQTRHAALTGVGDRPLPDQEPLSLCDRPGSLSTAAPASYRGSRRADGSSRRGPAATPATIEWGGTPAAPEDLAGHDCIIYEGFQAPDVWTFARGQADLAITIRPRLVVSTIEAACDAALAGIGLTRAFSYHVGPSIEEGALATVLDEYRLSPLTDQLRLSGQPVPAG